MGGELRGGAGQGSPLFLVQAQKDPDGANLDRIQVIKGWVDEAGESHERIYNLAAGGGRDVAADGSLEPVGNTVNVAEASYSNTIGSPTLYTAWRDPDFDPALESFYYARVIEIPTPSWRTYDAKLLQIEAPEPASIQERAVSSAIWYAPE